MIKLLAIWNAILTLSVAALGLALMSMRHEAKSDAMRGALRTSRVEIVDRSGKTKAVLGLAEGATTPRLVFYSEEGREAAFLALNKSGYGTLYFQSAETEGKVSVGYLWGSDTLGKDEAEDPLAAWGLRIRGSDGRQTNVSLPNDSQRGLVSLPDSSSPKLVHVP